MYTVITTKGTKPSNKKRQGQDPGKKEESIMTTIQINHKNNTIEMTKKFYTESCKYGKVRDINENTVAGEWIAEY